MILIYSKKNCKFCDMAKKILINNKVQYQERKIEDNNEYRDYLLDQGFKSVPQIWNGTEHIGGYQELQHFLSKEKLHVN